MKSGKVKLEAGKSSNEMFRAFGDTIIWTGTWEEKGTNDGKTFENKGPFTTVLAKDGGDWKVVSDQVTRLAAVKPDMTGAWQQYGRIDENGKVQKIGESDRVTLKFLSNGKWVVCSSDVDTGEVFFHHGGSYEFDGSNYVERIEFANVNTQSLMEEEFRFKVKFDDDKFMQFGQGNPYSEVWQRVKQNKKD